MIQRIQSVWLLVAGILALLTLILPTYSGGVANTNTYQELTARNAGFFILFITVLIAVLAFVAIGMFKNRSMQLKLCIVGIVAEALVFFLYYQKSTAFVQGTYALGAILHPIIILLFVLAGKGINNDEKLIRDSDRLR
ncbi:MAG: hypothetical protein RLY16_576 [Bacteroidota bacterium]|jgi:peptidoglycan/LPS O-acetylase OafA/YrhL